MTERDEEGEDSALDKDSPKQHSNPWKRLIFEKPDRVAELIFAGAVVLFAFLGWRSSKSSSTQTDQLISAAKFQAYASKQNANAAGDFAASSRNINQGIGEAVAKLNIQAQATSDVADATEIQAKVSEGTLDEAKKVDRPMLQVTDRYSGGDLRLAPDGTGTFFVGQIEWRNFGRVAAEDVFMQVAVFIAEDPNLVIDDMERRCGEENPTNLARGIDFGDSYSDSLQRTLNIVNLESGDLRDRNVTVRVATCARYGEGEKGKREHLTIRTWVYCQSASNCVVRAPMAPPQVANSWEPDGSHTQ